MIEEPNNAPPPAPGGIHFRRIEERDIPALFSIRIATWEDERGQEALEALGITPAAVADILKREEWAGWISEVDGEPAGASYLDRVQIVPRPH